MWLYRFLQLKTEENAAKKGDKPRHLAQTEE
jgi:hypothetical protein